MNMLYGSRRETYRQLFIDYWQRFRAGQPLDAMAQRVVEVIRAHPEYHALLENPEMALEADFPPELGQSNPFAHMSLHVALLELLATGQPPGIVQAYGRLRTRYGEAVAEHRVVDCLGELLWQAQRAGREPDLSALLPCLQADEERETLEGEK
ncbi:DUF1841 family protein [Acidithiobacillus sp. YTS05]|nr:DUF1841 family protein [Igneacidithiobacillus copahuensis]UTV80313.1 DUF1841 family protein [Acidithiobacillus sp. YTS05]